MEEACILCWTALLVWLPKCKMFPVVCDIMTDPTVVLSFAAVNVVLMLLAWVLSYTRFGGGGGNTLPPSKTGLARYMTLLGAVRMTLCLTLPTLGTMGVMHPASVGAACLLKKLALLEGRLWRQWCPEAYITFISICCILVIARRASFYQTARRYERFRQQSHAHF